MTEPEAAWRGDPPIRITKYIRQAPTEPQQAFLYCDHVKEILYGGAAGGGKSSALLGAALQYVDIPGYAALLLRRTFRDLNQPDALIPRSQAWLHGTGATWNSNDSRWTFPSGASITFGYLKGPTDHLQYQGAAYQAIFFDELTQFNERQYTYLFSRCRRPEIPDDAPAETRRMLQRLAQVPLRVRAGSNPGGPGHEWVKSRFGLYRPAGDGPDTPLMCHRPDDWPAHRLFIPARLSDNPYLDQDSYAENLAELDHHTRAQLLDGDWDSRLPGDLFHADWFGVVDEIPEGCRWVRFWDLAATEPSDANPDPDWTVGMRIGLHPNGTLFIEDVVRVRRRSADVERLARVAADRDGPGTRVLLEQEPGSSGKTVVDNWIRNVLPDRAVSGRRSSGSKFDRATVASAKAEQGLIKLKRAPWNVAFLDEVTAFSADEDAYAHDDQVDTLSGGLAALVVTAAGVKTVAYAPRRGGEPVVRRGDLTLRGRHHIDTDT